jgi:hypothetical protein
MEFPENTNIIVGQAHFIKTTEDLYEAMVNSVPAIRFGLAFCEASGDRLIRKEGNDDELIEVAVANASRLGAGHAFVLILRDAFPIHVLNAVKSCPEVCHVFCATANPLEILVVESEQGRGIAGVIDGGDPLGVEDATQISARRKLLRTIHYKL